MRRLMAVVAGLRVVSAAGLSRISAAVGVVTRAGSVVGLRRPAIWPRWAAVVVCGYLPWLPGGCMPCHRLCSRFGGGAQVDWRGEGVAARFLVWKPGPIAFRSSHCHGEVPGLCIILRYVSVAHINYIPSTCSLARVECRRIDKIKIGGDTSPAVGSWQTPRGGTTPTLGSRAVGDPPL